MGYEIVSPSERVERACQKFLSKVPAEYQEAIVAAIRPLAFRPRPQGKRTKRLAGQLIVSQFIAQYRCRIGPYRPPCNIDDPCKKVILLKLAKRDEQTYS